jgi:hypothetical protein
MPEGPLSPVTPLEARQYSFNVHPNLAKIFVCHKQTNHFMKIFVQMRFSPTTTHVKSHKLSTGSDVFAIAL